MLKHTLLLVLKLKLKFRADVADRKVRLAFSEAAAVARHQQPGAAAPQATGVPVTYGLELEVRAIKT